MRRIQIQENRLETLTAKFEEFKSRTDLEIRELKRRVRYQETNHLLSDIPIWDEEQDTGIKTVLDVRDAVRQLADVLDCEIVVRKGEDSYAMLVSNS